MMSIALLTLFAVVSVDCLRLPRPVTFITPNKLLTVLYARPTWDIFGRVDVIEKDLQDVKAKLNSFEVKLNNFDDKLNTFDDKLNSVQNKLDSMQTMFVISQIPVWVILISTFK